MLLEYLYSKIHRATVTDSNFDYVGSITVDELLMQKAGIVEGQKVDVLNVTNGERFQTYVIKGQRAHKDICVNGAAAHKAKKGDIVIIVAYASMSPEEYEKFKPSIVLVDDTNTPLS